MGLCCLGSGTETGTNADTGLPKRTEVFDRNLAEVIEDMWKLLVLLFQQFPAFVKVRETGVFPEKWGF